mmetsp:Transcript_5517/g.15562  ORF Transcript_5517/g.15562 Transcript_5517/m.15562 type:complete len:89 (+) Transcript_5517:35-301(+)|eukprot:CAMPEP_0181025338 /NCGR_PEP_ID=MMETSP1070-20121207/3049_1 /TAXON_ID=265543 /ORGANISM="Minutocellus polymorphus, Strain NH13" /LENGTH=88 /DNA_ID=CAMNT_0023102449 /DNA_START=204 /DNA_END=470 /DNA_ORIENTATION=-
MRYANLLNIFPELLLAQLAQLARPEHVIVKSGLHKRLVLGSITDILPRMMDSKYSQIILEGMAHEYLAMEDRGDFAPAFIEGDGAIAR